MIPGPLRELLAHNLSLPISTKIEIKLQLPGKFCLIYLFYHEISVQDFVVIF